MKTLKFFSHAVALLPVFLYANAVVCQTPAARSSKSAAQYDAECIRGNISDNHDVQFFSQLAKDRGSATEIKELADEMFADFTGLLYSVEQLNVAGAGSSGGAQISEMASKETKEWYQKISSVRGFQLDTIWVSGMLALQQTMFNKLQEQKQNVTDSRLKTSVTESIPVVRKYISRMTTLQKMLIKRDIQQKKEAARKEKENAKTRH